jgi:hypothetical protein
MKLAHKGKKADCHSDNVKDEQQAKLVQVNTLKAHGVTVNESGAVRIRMTRFPPHPMS